MADKLEILNGALRLLGPHQLSSLVEDSEPQRALSSAWQATGDYLLSEGFWNFALRAVELGADDDLGSLFGYEHSYIKPDDWVRTQAISSDESFSGQFEDYSDENGHWCSDSDILYVRYVSNDEDYGWNVGGWGQQFAKAFEAYLAFECGLPISGDRGNRDGLYSLFRNRLKRAKTLDAVDERVQLQRSGRWARARGGGPRYRTTLGWVR